MSALPLSEAITRYLFPWLERDWPIDWCQAFGREADLVVEAGFGNGSFLAEKAAESPEANYVGIERSLGAVQRLFKRLDRDGLTNVRVLQGDAAFILRHAFAPGSIGRIYINFSDPWPKERHHGRRLIQPQFVKLLADRLDQDGSVTIATDHGGYAEWISEVLEDQTVLRSCLPTTSVHELPARNPTKYEQKAISAGVPIHYFVWQKGTDPVPTAEPEKVGDMPNVTLEGSWDPETLLSDVESQSWKMSNRGVMVVIKLVGVYSEARGDRLVEMIVKEDELSQHIGVLVTQRPGSRLLAKLSPLGHPRPTWGVKQAVGKVAELIVQESPQLRIAASTVSGLGEE